MNLLCPNCQQPLSVEEQYAGQLMKCPKCGGNFTVPALPQAAPVPSLAPEPAPAAPAPAPAHDEDHGGSSTYGLKPDVHTPPPHDPARPPLELPSQRTATVPPPPRPPLPTSEPRRVTEEYPAPPPPAAPGPSREGYHRTASLSLNPEVLTWLPPVALVLAFVLSFFPWVGRFPGGHSVDTQNAWQAAFGGHSVDPVYENKVQGQYKMLLPEDVGASVLMIFFLLAFLAALALAVVVVVLPHTNAKLPPAAERLMPWRWALVAALTFVAFVLLVFQLVTRFNLMTATQEQVAKNTKPLGDAAKTPEEIKVVEIIQGQLLGAQVLRRTGYLLVSFLLLLLAWLAAAAMHWLQLRGPDRPRPRMEWMW
jgi:hypothetical protein